MIKTIITIIISLTVGGCTMMQAISNPSESLYEKANRYYEEKNYIEAIPLYKKVIDENPHSSLVIPSQLNLGMSYYYAQDYKNAYNTLKNIELKDEPLLAFISRILKDCESRIGPEAAAAEAAAGEETLSITVTDASLPDIDRTSTIRIKGYVDRPAEVFVEGKKAEINANNVFSAMVSWRKGLPIIITARDESQNNGRLEYFPDTEPPEEPENLRVINLSSNSVEIEWDENIEEDIYGYKIYYDLKNGTRHEVREIIRDERYEIVGLENYVEGANRTFQFYIKAVDKMGNYSVDSSDILEVTLP